MADYFVQSGGILKNKLGINDSAEFKTAEQKIVAEKSATLLNEAPQVFNFDYLLHVHKILFEDLYDFAGQLRTVNIAKPDATAPFANAQFLRPECDRIFGELTAKKYLSGLPHELFVNEITSLAADLNALHPFPEGNGRAIRLFLMLLADHAGYLLDYSLVTAAMIIHADKTAFNGDTEPLFIMYRKIVSEL